MKPVSEAEAAELRDEIVRMQAKMVARDVQRQVNESLVTLDLDAFLARAREEFPSYAVARDDVPALVAEVRRLRGLIHAETIAEAYYCETHELGFMGGGGRCPHCTADEVEEDLVRLREQHEEDAATICMLRTELAEAQSLVRAMLAMLEEHHTSFDDNPRARTTCVFCAQEFVLPGGIAHAADCELRLVREHAKGLL